MKEFEIKTYILKDILPMSLFSIPFIVQIYGQFLFLLLRNNYIQNANGEKTNILFLQNIRER